jgi:hypothetical protein
MLLFQLVVVLAWIERSEHTMNPFAKNPHHVSPSCHASPRNSVRMMSAIRSHACRSLASWRRPATVSA